MKNKNIRKLTKFSKGSLGVVLPAQDLHSLGWKQRQKLEVKRVAGGFMIRDAKTKKQPPRK